MATFTTGEVLREDIVSQFHKSGVNTSFTDVLYTVDGGERVTLQLLDLIFFGDANAVNYTMSLFIQKFFMPGVTPQNAPPSILNLIDFQITNANIAEVTYYTSNVVGTINRDAGFYGQYFLADGDSLRLSVNAFTSNVNLTTDIKYSLKKYSLFS